MIDLDADDLRGAFGLGVAGNFAGHLEQAGEAADFSGIEALSHEAPKGVFPWYAPGDPGFLGVFPLSGDRLARPAGSSPANLQIEPEVGLVCTAGYGRDRRVQTLVPSALGAFNDCSIRRPGAPKISHKKNWGPDSKGLARRLFPISDLGADGSTATLRLASFLCRTGETHDYGVDSPLIGYTYYGDRLLAWIVDRLVNQSGAPGSPLESVGAQLAAAGCPATLVIGIGATRYTPFGQSAFLEPDDEAVVVVYDATLSTSGDVRDAVGRRAEEDLPAASVLRQRVYEPE